MDILTLGIIFLSVFGALIGFFIGKITDPFFKVKLLRSLDKKAKWIILAIVSKDRRSIRRLVVNPMDDVVNIKNSFWTIEANKIYRVEKEKNKVSSFEITQNMVKWEEGVPVVYCDEDNIIPLNFHSNDTNVKPDEVGSILLSWVNNQLAKGLSTIQQHRTLLLVILILGVLTLAFNYFIWDKLDDIQKVCVMGTSTASIVPEGGKIEGDKIVITQK